MDILSEVLSWCGCGYNPDSCVGLVNSDYKLHLSWVGETLVKLCVGEKLFSASFSLVLMDSVTPIATFPACTHPRRLRRHLREANALLHSPVLLSWCLSSPLPSLVPPTGCEICEPPHSRSSNEGLCTQEFCENFSFLCFHDESHSYRQILNYRRAHLMGMMQALILSRSHVGSGGVAPWRHS